MVGFRSTFSAIVAGALALSACASTPRVSDADLAKRIGQDAAAFNVAYSKAVNAQILLNILRSRDRQPRYYLSMSGITDAPSFLYGDSFSIGGAPIGEQRGQPFGIGSFGVRRETTSKPTYTVQPLDAKTLSKAVFQPTPSNVFVHYWESGWPRDMLLLLMVERIAVTENGVTREYTNEANDIQNDCATPGASRGCAFVSATRGFLAAIADKSPAPPGGAKARAVCGLVEAYNPAAPVREGLPPQGLECAPGFVVGAATYRFDLRSFDDMVYYVGELMRPAYTESQGQPSAAMEARVTVRVAGLRGGGKGAPLFRILPESAAVAGETFAAAITYDGGTYYAGPPIGRSCADSTPEGLCKDDPAHGDRSSSVLSLLAELLALNQSPDAIRAPARLFAD